MKSTRRIQKTQKATQPAFTPGQCFERTTVAVDANGRLWRIEVEAGTVRPVKAIPA